MSREMRHSGVDWIGEIPCDWICTRIKTVFSERTEFSTTGNEKLLSVSEYYGVDCRANRIEDGDFLSRSESLIGYKKCYVGDFVSNIMLAWKGSFGVTKIDGIVSPAYCVYKPKDSVYPYYYHYLFRTSLYTTRFKLFSKGIIDSRLRLYSPYFYNVETIIPPLSEQKRIADYLDKVCEEVDKVILLHEQMIEELKAYKQSVITEAVTKGLNPDASMKASGIDWLGEIPEDWIIEKLKFLISYIESGVSVNAGNVPANNTEKGVLKTSSVSKFVFDVNENKTVYPYEENRVACPVRANTIIVSRMNTPELVGACGYVDSDYDNIFLPDRLWQVHFKNAVHVKYIWFVLRSSYIRNYYSSLSVGSSSSMQNISQDQFSNAIIALPQLHEQQAIGSFLDEKCSEIDSLIGIKQQKIEELKEYKKSIIYEYVTGKKEVV